MNVLVIGDVIIDRYTHGTKRGLSAETPTVVANLGKEEMFVGGAGLVCRNLVRLGNRVDLVTVMPSDIFDVNYLRDYVCESSDPLTSEEMSRFRTFTTKAEGWKVTEKRRYYVEDYKLLQYDDVNQGKWTPFGEDQFLRQIMRYLHVPSVLNKSRHLLLKRENKEIDERYKQYGAIVVCDNRHGVISEHVAKGIVRAARKMKIPLYVDSQVSQASSNHHWYKGADFVFLNEIESDVVANQMKRRSYRPGRGHLDMVAHHLKSCVVYKRGAKGSVVVHPKESMPIVTNGFKVDTIDTCGAGDAFLAAFVSAGNDSKFANRWAALSTTYKGTIVPELKRLEEIPE